MTPKQKAKELFDKFYYLFPEKRKIDFGYNKSKQCALITVDDILKLPSIDDGRMIVVIKEDYDYWQEVKNEIEKL